jgi:NTP pyrophosphatase (non-canonical NTP hydrolase)
VEGYAKLIHIFYAASLNHIAFVSLSRRVKSKLMSDLIDLQQRVAEFRDARDWKQFHTPKDLSMAIAIEAAELMECFLWKSKDQVDKEVNSDKLVEINEEISDILILLLNLADILGVEIIKVANQKLDLNGKKYPIAKAKGNAKKYTELAKE